MATAILTQGLTAPQAGDSDTVPETHSGTHTSSGRRQQYSLRVSQLLRLATAILYLRPTQGLTPPQATYHSQLLSAIGDISGAKTAPQSTQHMPSVLQESVILMYLICQRENNGRVFNRLVWINPVRAGSLGLDSSKLAKKNDSTSSGLFTLTLLAATSR